MERVAGVLVAIALVVLLGGCWGPQMVTRGFDDWLNEGYVRSPWLYGNAVSYAMWSTGFMLTNLADAFANMYYFWVKDAQPFGNGVGTRYDHHKPVTPK